MPRMKRALPWLSLAALLVAAAAYWLFAGRARDVDVTPVRQGKAVELVYATGFVEAEHPVSVAARLTAPVKQVLVREGATVRRNQALVLLDDQEQRNLLAQAEAQRRGAALAEQRTLALFAKGWVTRAARDEAVATADAARAAEEGARARLDQMVVRSGIDGIVLRRDVEPGDLVTPTRTLMLLGDPALVWVTATVDERDVPHVRPGQPALMSSDAWPGRVIHGHVREVTPGGDPEQRAFRARITIDDRTSLPLGLTLEVNIVTRQVDRALLVPTTAVTNGHVWTVQKARARQKAVRTGISGSNETQILSGLVAGEQVVKTPDADITEGMRVRTAGQ